MHSSVHDYLTSHFRWSLSMTEGQLNESITASYFANQHSWTQTASSCDATYKNSTWNTIAITCSSNCAIAQVQKPQPYIVSSFLPSSFIPVSWILFLASHLLSSVLSLIWHMCTYGQVPTCLTVSVSLLRHLICEMNSTNVKHPSISI